MRAVGTNWQVICNHLCKTTGKRYYAVQPFPNVWQAWCKDCHSILREEGGWTERAQLFAGLALVCASCFNDIVSRHKRVRLSA